MSRVFLTQKVNDFDAGTLVMNSEALGSNVDNLVSEGKAILVDLQGYDAIRSEAKTLHSKYTADRKRLINSDNPLYSNRALLDYELRKIDEGYHEEVKAIQSKYEAYKVDAMQQAQQEKAQETNVITDKDAETARQFVDRASIELLTRPGTSHAAYIEELAQDIHNLTEGQRAALMRELPSLLKQIDDIPQRKKLANAVQAYSKGALAVSIAEQLPHTATIEYSHMKAYTRNRGLL